MAKPISHFTKPAENIDMPEPEHKDVVRSLTNAHKELQDELAKENPDPDVVHVLSRKIGAVKGYAIDRANRRHTEDL